MYDNVFYDCAGSASREVNRDEEYSCCCLLLSRGVVVFYHGWVSSQEEYSCCCLLVCCVTLLKFSVTCIIFFSLLCLTCIIWFGVLYHMVYNIWSQNGLCLTCKLTQHLHSLYKVTKLIIYHSHISH